MDLSIALYLLLTECFMQFQKSTAFYNFSSPVIDILVTLIYQILD